MKLEGFGECMPGVLNTVLERVFTHPLCGRLVGMLTEHMTDEGKGFYLLYFVHLTLCSDIRAYNQWSQLILKVYDPIAFG